MLLTRKYSSTVWLVWHCVAAIAIVVILSQLRFGWSLSTSPTEHLVFLTELVAAYIGSAIFLGWRTRSGRSVGFADILLSVFAFVGGCALILLVRQAYSSPFMLSLAFAAFASLTLLSFVLSPSILVLLAVILGVVAAVLQPLKDRPKEYIEIAVGAVPKPHKTQTTMMSGLYPIKATFYDNYFDVCDTATGKCEPPRNGGGISAFSSGYLAATGEGFLHFFTVEPASGTLNTKQLRYTIPINSEAFSEQAPKQYLNIFRVMDILVREGGNHFTLFASHHHWKLDQHCFVVRVSKLEGEVDAFLAGTMQQNWQTVFETKPCLPIKSGPHGQPFSGDESGGRFALLDDHTLLVTVGDHQFDGWNSTQMLAQDESADYGKIVALDLATGQASHYTMGHRNAQGLYIAPDSTIWETEHGPSGGDELNILVKGKNYGWPLVTYGTEYLRNDWPLNKTPGDHEGFERPIFSWMPSIAISNLIGVRSPLFPQWKNDLLVCTFLNSLLRIRVRDGRVAYVEQIELRQRNGRLRDVMEDKDGRIVFWIDLGAVAFLEPVSPASASSPSGATVSAERGQALYASCAPCHKVGNGTSHGVGPDLAAIVGRPIGTAQSFVYSEAMKKQSGDWTEKRLEEFLANPQQAVPGTSMRFPAIESAEDRASLIAYLKTLKRQ